MDYWMTLQKFVKENKICIDRPKGSCHPVYNEVIYPFNYGYLSGTTAMDGSGIDIFVGSMSGNRINGIICTADDLKKDAEIKIIYDCSDEEINTVLQFMNKGHMRGIFVKNPNLVLK